MAKRKKRKVLLGKIKSWTDAAVDNLSIISPEDIEIAKANVIPELSALLNAKQKEKDKIVDE